MSSEDHEQHSTHHSALNKAGRNLSDSGVGRSIAAGMRGEQVSTQGVLEAVGGVRGLVETLLPGMLYLVGFVITQDARLSVIAPAVLALSAVFVRLVKRQSLVTSLSGVLGVAVCVATTLITGRGEDYFLPGFWINGAWIVALLISLLIGWPLLGFLVGALRGDLTGWKHERHIRRLALVATSVWLTMFVLRLGVQLPLYFAEEVAWLGVARLVMGIPLFALVILFTWMLFHKTLKAESPTSE